jgi:hypothetical protein
MQYDMSIMNGFRLTTSQQEALDSFREFLNGSKQVFMLKGAAEPVKPH